MVLVFEKLNLDYGEHSVEITLDDKSSTPIRANGARVVEIDAIDINEDGELLPLNYFIRIQNANISKYYLYDGEKSTIQATLTDEKNMQLKYQVLVNNNILYDFTELAPSPQNISFDVNYNDLIDNQNTVTIRVEDESGISKDFNLTLYKDPLAAPSMQRSVDEFEDSWEYDNSVVSKEEDGFKIGTTKEFVKDESWSDEGVLYRMALDLTNVKNMKVR